MKNIEDDDLPSITGGAATVAPKQLDVQTEATLKKLTTDIEDLAEARNDRQGSQLTQMMTVMMMSKLKQR